MNYSASTGETRGTQIQRLVGDKARDRDGATLLTADEEIERGLTVGVLSVDSEVELDPSFFLETVIFLVRRTTVRRIHGHIKNHHLSVKQR